MCDTIVALGPSTRDGVTLFGKNSNREPDEAQNIVIIPRKQLTGKGSLLKMWGRLWLDMRRKLLCNRPPL